MNFINKIQKHFAIRKVKKRFEKEPKSIGNMISFKGFENHEVINKDVLCYIEVMKFDFVAYYVYLEHNVLKSSSLYLIDENQDIEKIQFFSFATT